MTWNRWYATKSYLRSALWIVPLIALICEQIAIRITSAADVYFEWVPLVATTVAGTDSALDLVIASTMSFLVFTFGSMLVAIQVASGQLTPRIIATTLLRDNIIRCTVGLFVFTMLFAAGTRARIESTVPHLTSSIAIVLGIASITAFLFLIDYTARLLRPIAIVWRIGEQGISVIEAVYPGAIEGEHIPTPLRQPLPCYGRIIEHRGRSAIVLAVNLQALTEIAASNNGIIEFVPRVGDFVAEGEPLFLLYAGAVGVRDGALRAQVAFGPERTIEQDSTFAFRVIVDIAIKALSQAINDPTTAILAIDQLHRLLRLVGRRHLHDDTLIGPDGAVRLIVRTPDWDDFVQLACSEIRLYGAGNFQVARRLRAMLQVLIASLPETRISALRSEINLLDQTLETIHLIPENLALARQADLQGLGGSSPANLSVEH